MKIDEKEGKKEDKRHDEKDIFSTYSKLSTPNMGSQDRAQSDEAETGMSLLLRLDKFLLFQSECAWLDGDGSSTVGQDLLTSASELAFTTRRVARKNKYLKFVNFASELRRGSPVKSIPQTFLDWDEYIQAFRVPLLENVRSEMASQAGLFSPDGVIRFRRMEVVRWGEDEKGGGSLGGKNAAMRNRARDMKNKARNPTAFDDDYYQFEEVDGNLFDDPRESMGSGGLVRESMYRESDAPETPQVMDQSSGNGRDYSKVVLKVRPNELKGGDVLLISEVDVASLEAVVEPVLSPAGRGGSFKSRSSNRKGTHEPSGMPHNPLLDKIGILHVDRVFRGYLDPKRNRTIETVAICSVSQFSTPLNGPPTSIYISEALTSSIPVNRVFASLQDACKDRLATSNLRRAILEGRFDYATAVADAATYGAIPVDSLNRSQQKAHDAAIATVAESGICLIQGPPGTGKTKTTASIMKTLLNRLEMKILLCAPTNIAMTSVAQRLVSSRRDELGVDVWDPLEVVVMGNRDKLKDVMAPEYHQFSMEMRVECVARCLESLARGIQNALALSWQGFSSKKGKKRAELDARQVEARKVQAVYEVVKHYCAEMRGLVGNVGHFELSLITPFDQVNRFIGLCMSLRGSAPDGSSKSSMKVDNPQQAVLQAAERIPGQIRAVVAFDKTGDLDGLGNARCLKFAIALKKLFLDKARAIFSTLNGSYSTQLIAENRFNVVIVDEAAQAMEAETTCILRPSVKALILVGDTKQLEATVMSETCVNANLGRSLVERLQSLNHPVYMLEEQYRMHPKIARFCSGIFYDGWLMDSEYVKTYDPAWYRNEEYSAVQFVAHNGTMHTRDSGGSSSNEGEAQLICDRIAGFLKDHLSLAVSIGIICPYKAQKHLLESKLKSALAPLRHNADISVNTVDGFQGQERDVILLSLTRVDHVSGFLDDLRRVNVSLTRARYSMWVYGDQRTYAKCMGQFGSFGWFYDHCEKNGFVRKVQWRNAKRVDEELSEAEVLGASLEMLVGESEDRGHAPSEVTSADNMNRAPPAVGSMEEMEQELLDAWSAAF
ncbi:P-loop containing nucleoside triphosphate hydrolase protein [Chytriomyces sp. MP71]|nr:P-loop containing nucleoside triphosphate hydrolase protein [Chytriomyces sp. MP71]